MDRIAIGSTKRFELHARKDGIVWDFTSAVVDLIIVRQNGTRDTLDCSIASPATDGIAYVVTPNSTFPIPETISAYFYIVDDGDIEDTTEPVRYQVYDPRKR